MIRRIALFAALPLASLATARAGGFRGDGSPMPSFGGWGTDPLPVDAAAQAGFDWFETGYPGDAHASGVLAAAGVRPFAYGDLSERDPALADDAGYTGPVLCTNGDGARGSCPT